MDYKDIKVGQKVRCVYEGLTSRTGKTATVVKAPVSEHDKITIKWDDGADHDTIWSYATSFEPTEVPVPQKNNVCCICGYQDEWVAEKDNLPACRVCAPKIASGDPNPSPEALKEEMAIAPAGNGFPKTREPEIALIKEAFTKLQDRSQYKAGDRIRIRIKNGKDVWATVLLGGADCLLFLDEEHKTGAHNSWITSDTHRQDILKELGLDPKLKRCFWWGDFSFGYVAGTSDISVLHKELPIPQPDLQDRSRYKHGDRIQISIKSGAPRWATVLDHKSNFGIAIYLDEAYKEPNDVGGVYSWITRETERENLIIELGLDPDKANCIFWGPGDGAKTLKENAIKVLHAVDSSKVARKKASEPSPPAKSMSSYKNGDRLQLKIGEHTTWATVVDDRGFFGNLTMPLLCLDQPNGGAHSDVPSDIAKDVENRGFSVKDPNFWWLEALDKVLHHGASLTNEPLKIGDALQYIGDNPIVGDNPPLVRGQIYQIRKLVPHDGSFKVFLVGFDGENDWWKTFRFAPSGVKNGIKPGDIVRCREALAPLKQDMLYRVSSSTDIGVRVEGNSSPYSATRFEIFKPVEETPIKYPVGARAQIHFGTKKEWGTIVGTVFGKEGEERPIISMNANARWATSLASSFLSEYGLDFTDTVKKLGLNESEPRCWLALPDEVLQVVPKGSAEVDLPLPEPPAPNPFVIKTQNIPPAPQPFTINIQDGSMNTNGGDLVFSGGINTIPLTIKFDLGEWKFQSEAPITINGKKEDPVNPENSGVDFSKENFLERHIEGFDKKMEILVEQEDGTLKPEFWARGPSFSKDAPKEQSFGSMIKEDAVNAGYRVAATQLTKGVKAALLKLMEDRGTDNNKVALIREILETEVGNVLISMLLGMSLTYIPAINKDERAKKLAGEFRIGSLTTTGNALMDMVWQYVKSLPQPEKVRVNTTEVRVAEELEEEIIEDEKSSSLGV